MRIKGLILLITSLIFCLCCYAVQKSNQSQPSVITFGDKEWKLASKYESKDNLILQYVTDHENINNWTQLFTYHKFRFAFPPQITPIMFAENQLSALKSKGYQYLYTQIESTNNETLVEFRIVSPVDYQQVVLKRFIRIPTNEVIELIYATRKSDISPAERAMWIKALKNIDLTLFKNNSVPARRSP